MEIKTCDKCHLCLNNSFKPVIGRGNIKGLIHFITDTPTSTDSKVGFALSGKSGKKLQSYVDKTKLNSISYFTSSVKCKPNRNVYPTSEQIKTCRPYLSAELIIGNPKIVVLLGLIAINSYFRTNLTKIGSLLNKPIVINNRVIICTYHPAYILRDAENETYYVELFKLLNTLYKYYKYNRL
jgi:DNA polymerase